MRGILAVIVEIALVGAGIAVLLWWLGNPSRLPWPVAIYSCMSLVTWAAYHRDKRRARENRWRIPEATLHVLALLGGWPGAVLAQQMLRHKTAKARFLVVFWLIVGLHAAAWIGWWLAGRT